MIQVEFKLTRNIATEYARRQKTGAFVCYYITVCDMQRYLVCLPKHISTVFRSENRYLYNGSAMYFICQ